MTRLRVNHDWNLAKWDLVLLLVVCNQIWRGGTSFVTVSLPLLNGEVYKALDLVSQISNTGVVGEIWVKLSLLSNPSMLIFQGWLSTCVDFVKLGNQTSIFFVHFVRTWHELSIDFNEVGLMLPNAVWNCVLYKLVKWLNLLIYDTILLEKGIDKLPLIFFIDLGFSHCIILLAVDVSWDLTIGDLRWTLHLRNSKFRVLH